MREEARLFASPEPAYVYFRDTACATLHWRRYHIQKAGDVFLFLVLDY